MGKAAEGEGQRLGSGSCWGSFPLEPLAADLRGCITPWAPGIACVCTPPPLAVPSQTFEPWGPCVEGLGGDMPVSLGAPVGYF